MRKASETWCPFVPYTHTAAPANNWSGVSRKGRVPVEAACIGSKCSAWQNINHHSMEELAEVIEGQYGRCGLSNGGLMEDE